MSDKARQIEDELNSEWLQYRSIFPADSFPVIESVRWGLELPLALATLCRRVTNADEKRRT